jgi:hypothetical protein
MSYDPGNPGNPGNPGYPGNPGPGYGYPPQEQKRGSGMAIAALVLGILAFLLSITVVGGIVLGLIAVIVGILASGRAKRGLAGGRGMAITGIVLGVLALLISVGLAVLGLSILNSDSGKTYQSCVKAADGDQAKVKKCAEEFSRTVSG